MPLTFCVILVAAMPEANAPEYSPNPTSKLPLKPIIMDDAVVNTVPITDAITFTPHSKVISWLEEEAILVMDGN